MSIVLNDTVTIKHQTELGEMKVVGFREVEPFTTLNGVYVPRYVDIQSINGGPVLGYHDDSLEKSS